MIPAKLACANVVKASEAEAERIARHYRVADAAAWLVAERGMRLVAITRGAASDEVEDLHNVYVTDKAGRLWEQANALLANPVSKAARASIRRVMMSVRTPRKGVVSVQPAIPPTPSFDADFGFSFGKQNFGTEPIVRMDWNTCPLVRRRPRPIPMVGKPQAVAAVASQAPPSISRR